MQGFNTEMIEKAKKAKSAKELLEVAKAGGVEMTADEAATYFAQLNPKSGELDDDALDGVAGGCGGSGGSGETYRPYGKKVRVTSGHICEKCGTNVGVYSVGDVYDNYPYIVCKPCNYTIARDDGTITYEVIG